MVIMDLDFEEHSKRRKTTQEDGPQTTGMELLPREIARDILSRLPITSLVKFKCVCRAWRAMAVDPQVVNLYSSCSTQDTDPCVILHSDFPIRNNLYFVDFAADDEEKDKVKRLQAPFSSRMPEFEVVGSCNGFAVPGRLTVQRFSLYLQSFHRRLQRAAEILAVSRSRSGVWVWFQSLRLTSTR
ncbi:hypothetical protein OIU79_016556 [Salix purpurea]|uniref:F-box domain-containing protein n=1 Tax=Salix purpurea TaxID=77065 RepID=A0A9Q0PEP4_SALPP|nr:hypothetical protein OIU79_016556 [Salix purpurea]